MENQELMRYLKDAIEQETSIVEQEKMIEQVTELKKRQKPQLIVKNNDRAAPVLKRNKYGNTLFIWALILGFSLLVIGGIMLFTANWNIDFYTEYSYFGDDDLNAAYKDRSNALTVMVVSVLCFGVAGFSAWTTYKMNQLLLSDYNTELSAYNTYTSELKRQNNELSKEHNAQMNAWKASYLKLKAHMDAPLTESQALLEKFYSSDVIYPKYRTLPALTSIYEYFMTGRCTELTGPHGAYNLYEDELRKDTVISQLNTVIENLEQIRYNQYMLYQQVKAIQENTAVIASELNQIKGYTVQIAQLTALNAYYAALNERNTRITMYYHL